MSFSVCNKLSVNLVGDQEKLQAISTYFSKEFDIGGAPTPADIEISATGSTSHNPSRVYGVSGGRDGVNFVVPDGAGHWCTLDPGKLKVSQDLGIRLDVCCGLFRPTVLLDWLVMPIAHFALAAFLDLRLFMRAQRACLDCRAQ